jgi:predicted metal-dependent hydrolase
MIRQIDLNGKNVNYEYQQKEVKNINLRIKSDKSVIVSANSSVPIETIEDFLISRSTYILNALNYYEELEKYAPKPKRFVNGESITVLGRDMRISVREGQKNKVESDVSFVYITVKDTNDYEQKRKTFDKWMKKLCRETINSICESVFPKFKKYDVEYPVVRYRNMVSRWGSCQPKRKTLTFNYRLVESPIFCIEYVVTHEFTHFLYPNHSKQFYQQLSMFMPDWKERKDILEKKSMLKV